LNVEVTNVSFGIAGTCCGKKCQFMHGWNMYGSKTSISAWLESVEVKIVGFSMATTFVVQKRQLNHGWSVLWSKSSLSAWLECSGHKRQF
jgi:hypothetical protein